MRVLLFPLLSLLLHEVHSEQINNQFQDALLARRHVTNGESSVYARETKQLSRSYGGRVSRISRRAEDDDPYTANGCKICGTMDKLASDSYCHECLVSRLSKQTLGECSLCGKKAATDRDYLCRSCFENSRREFMDTSTAAVQDAHMADGFLGCGTIEKSINKQLHMAGDIANPIPGTCFSCDKEAKSPSDLFCEECSEANHRELVIKFGVTNKEDQTELSKSSQPPQNGRREPSRRKPTSSSRKPETYKSKFICKGCNKNRVGSKNIQCKTCKRHSGDHFCCVCGKVPTNSARAKCTTCSRKEKCSKCKQNRVHKQGMECDTCIIKSGRFKCPNPGCKKSVKSPRASCWKCLSDRKEQKSRSVREE